MKIDRTELTKALEIVKPGLANTELIEQSTSFAFLEDRVVTYNNSISISHPVKGLKLTGAIHSKELYEFLRRTKKDEVEIKATDREVQLKCGNSRAGLTLQQEVVLPLDEISEEKDWETLPEEIVDGISFVKDSSSRDTQRPILNCIHLTETMAEASDGFQIIRLYAEGFPFADCLLPAGNAREALRINPSLVARTDGWLHFKNADGTQISCRTLEDEYPNTDGHFQVDGEGITFPKTMNEILDRVRVFTATSTNEFEEVMEVELKDNRLTVKARNEYGWFKEPAKIKYAGKPVSFWVAPVLLKNILSKSDQCTLGERKIKFEGEGWEYVAVLKAV